MASRVWSNLRVVLQVPASVARSSAVNLPLFTTTVSVLVNIALTLVSLLLTLLAHGSPSGELYIVPFVSRR